jgi:hypothetical protein
VSASLDSSPRIVASQPGLVAARSKSNRPVPSTWSSGTRPWLASTCFAPGLSRRNNACSAASSSGATRSCLLSTSTSANSTCSISRSSIVRSSSSPSARPRSRRSIAWPRSPGNAAASTTVTIVSSRATSASERPSSSANVNVSATGSGSEMPVDSTIRWSKRPSSASRRTSTSRSSRSVQQMQPFESSTSFSSTRSRLAEPATRAASMLTSLMSLTITATRRPALLSSTCCKSVVLPAPRKPDSTVTGNGPHADRGAPFTSAAAGAGPRRRP